MQPTQPSDTTLARTNANPTPAISIAAATGVDGQQPAATGRHQFAQAPSKKSSKPSAKVRRRLQEAVPLRFIVDGLAHDGRGVAVYGNASKSDTDSNNEDNIAGLNGEGNSDGNMASHAGNAGNDSNKHQGFNAQLEHPSDKHGKKVFVSFALPDETVNVRLTNRRKSFEEGDAIAVLDNPHPQRQTPPCPHFGVCGGCSLQHWQPDAQIAFKQTVLAEMLEHQAGVQPDNWLAPLVGERLGYRTKARMGVRYVAKKQTALVGFRERNSNFLAELNECHVLDERIGFELNALKQLISSLASRSHIAQIELAMGEAMPDLPDGDQPVALILRNLQPLATADIDKLKAFFSARHWQLYLQPKGPASIERIALHSSDDSSRQFGRLYYALPEFDLTYEFIPTDFTQVNLSVNRKMTKLACDLLDLKPGERVLDLFSGLGNFSLPLARLVGGDDGKQGVCIGVEGSDAMTARAADNAKRNGITNTAFYNQDLTQDFSHQPWAQQGFDAILIDPPRSGAWEVMQYLPHFNAARIVYVSCNPATLARDSKALIAQGYRLTDAGVMDMFCHTSHVESIARFEKISLGATEPMAPVMP